MMNYCINKRSITIWTCLVVFILFLGFCHPVNASSSNLNYGDVNNDGTVNIVDAVLVLRHIVALIDISQLYGQDALRRAKVTLYDSEPTVEDAIAILKYTVGSISNLPIKLTVIVGNTCSNVNQAQKWAKNRGAHQRFIDIAPVYWEFGKLTGIRPEVLYAQSAKETNFGKYTGVVKPEQNNWAGIKTSTATGDLPSDHETFSSPRDGVRAHFNHMCAYVGKKPIDKPHDRYHLVMTISWAGTIRYVEELGGRWAPNPTYGNSIVDDYLRNLILTK